MRFQIWNKTDDIYTQGGGVNGGGAHFTAEQWADRYPWIKQPGAKMIITAGPINGGCVLEFEATKKRYKDMGAAITDGMTDDEVLAAIEAFEDNPPDPGPSVEERTAAALEFLAMNSLPDET